MFYCFFGFFDCQGSHSHANANAGAAADGSPELILLPGFSEQNAAVAPGPRIPLPPPLLLLLHAYRKQVGSGFDGRLKAVAAGGWHGWMSEV